MGLVNSYKVIFEIGIFKPIFGSVTYLIIAANWNHFNNFGRGLPKNHFLKSFIKIQEMLMLTHNTQGTDGNHKSSP
jgi:hypothetical protein